MTDAVPLPPPLADLGGAPVSAPDWFTHALAVPFEAGRVEREGASLAWKAWGRRGDPALVLIHGGTAHKGWWDALGPFLAAQGRRVIAPDLAGMGESGWRDVYTMAGHAADMRAAAEHAGAFESGKPIFIGHSFGGFVTLQAVTGFGGDLRAAVILDSPIRKPEKQREGAPPRRGGRAYPDLASALARFRLLPAQPCDNLWLVDHVARGSLKQTEEGWTWWFDPGLWAKLTYERRDPEAAAKALGCPLAFIRGERSDLMNAETWDYMRSVFTRSPFVTVPLARHHLILDDPLAVTAALDALIQGWAPA
ncbi:alpha/beta hydrolase [Alkalicaulis satelles]|uniref:Alpha/beta hydrolase n=1 Tax=Alkalicaulis satelles TaxID=2609175 RepID=A0A5M6ZI88_9PROT|nr:alpha/beta hydrolase [Alkalicaulis satelles]KAA5803417.1 alpha/beta hydrolase [Alkalicaulis satelles]